MDNVKGKNKSNIGKASKYLITIKIENKKQNIIIMGLTTDEKNINNDIKNLFKVLKLEGREKEASVKVLPTKTQYKPLLLKFSSQDLRNSVLTKKKELRNLMILGNTKVFSVITLMMFLSSIILKQT